MKTGSIFAAMAIITSIALAGCNVSKSDSDDGGGITATNPVVNDTYTLVAVGSDPSNGDAWTDFMSAKFDGNGNVSLDVDLDGNYGEAADDDPANIDYTAYNDNTLEMAGKFTGLFNLDRSLALAGDASSSSDTEVLLATVFLEGSGITEAFMNGNYGAVEMRYTPGTNTSTTHIAEITADGAGNGTREIVAASDYVTSPASPITYAMDARGNGWFNFSFLPDNHGMLMNDGGVFAVMDPNTSGGTSAPLTIEERMHFMAGVKTGTDMSDASLTGGYRMVEFIRKITGDDSHATYSHVTFDGNGSLTRSILENSEGTGGSTSGTYEINAEGAIIELNTGARRYRGYVSSDGKTFVLADIDDFNEYVGIAVGIKKEL